MFVIVDDRHKNPSYFWKDSSIGPLITLSLSVAKTFTNEAEAQKALKELSNARPAFQFRVAELIPKSSAL